MSEIRVNNIVSADGANAPTFPQGFSLATGMGITNSPNITGSAVTFSGISQITNSTDSTSSTTGALVVTGGVGIAKDVYIGAGLSVAGTLTYEDVTSVDSVGLITAKSGIDITGGGFEQTGGGEFKVGIGVTIASTSGVSTFANDVTFVGAGSKNVLWDKSNGAFQFDDNSRIKIGDSADLALYHDGSNSYIQHGNQGNLRYQSGNHDFYNQAGDEFQCRMTQNSDVKLYYDSGERLATTYEGAQITGFTSTTAGLGVTGGMWEGAFIKAGKLSDNATIGISTSNIFVFTTQESTTGTPNIVWNDTYALSSKMKVGDAVTVTVITTAAAGGYSANWNIDGNSVSEQWNGGSAPSAGGSDGYDVYTLTLVRKAAGTGNTGWLVFANVSNFT